MVRFVFLIGVLLVVVSPGQAQDEFGYFCNGVLPVEVSASIPLDFQALSFDSGLAGSGGAVTLTNKSDKGVQYYAAIMEFADEKGNWLISAPVYNLDKENRIPLDVPFKLWLLRNRPGSVLSPSGGGSLVSPIAARSSSRIAFNNAFVMLTCPASVQVAMVHVRYDDGTEFKYVSPRLRVSPAPSQSMEIRDIETAQRWSPIAVSGTIQIDAAGQARIIELNAASGEFSRWLKKEFAKWKFTPQWTDGQPTSVQLPFVFFLGDFGEQESLSFAASVKRRGARGPMLVWPSFAWNTSANPATNQIAAVNRR
jgi:hypothetical protein